MEGQTGKNNLHNKLDSDLKDAMRSKNEQLKNYIRSIKARVIEYKVTNNLSRESATDDSTMIGVIASHKRSLEKAIKQLSKGGSISDNLISEYRGEIEYCNKFLPSVREESTNINSAVDEAIKIVGNNIGKVIGYTMKQNPSFNGSIVRDIVLKKLKG